MADKTGIEWTDATWNPVTGCTKVSPGCDNCYAETFAERWRGTPGHYFEGGFDVQLRPDKLDLPLRWTKPRRIFVSMSDLFHDKIEVGYIARVFAVMAIATRHTFQVLTKRHGRARSLLNDGLFQRLVKDEMARLADEFETSWPLPNVWLGVSVEDQKRADLRIPALLETPAAVRWISAEPLLGPVNLARWLVYGCSACGRSGAWTDGRAVRLGDDVDEYWCQTCGAETPLPACTPPGLAWVVAGGESGPGARPMHPAWARSLRDQCQAAGVPYLFKQRGAYTWEAGSGWREPDLWVHDLTGQALPEHELPAAPTGSWKGVWRVGKKRAGRELDGREWSEYPR